MELDSTDSFLSRIEEEHSFIPDGDVSKLEQVSSDSEADVTSSLRSLSGGISWINWLRVWNAIRMTIAIVFASLLMRLIGTFRRKNLIFGLMPWCVL